MREFLITGNQTLHLTVEIGLKEKQNLQFIKQTRLNNNTHNNTVLYMSSVWVQLLGFSLQEPPFGLWKEQSR